MESRQARDTSAEQPEENKNKAPKRRRFMKPLGALALAISLPFVAPASQAVEYGATKAGDALIEGGKQMVEDTVDVAQDFFEDIRQYFER